MSIGGVLEFTSLVVVTRLRPLLVPYLVLPDQPRRWGRARFQRAVQRVLEIAQWAGRAILVSELHCRVQCLEPGCEERGEPRARRF